MGIERLEVQGVGERGRGVVRLSDPSGAASPTLPVASPARTVSVRSPDSFSDMGVVSRVLAGIDSVGSVPAKVSVYSQPMGRSIVTDIVVHETDQNDGTRKVGNHFQGAPLPPSETPLPDGIGASGVRVGAYEESRMAAREAYMMFQGMKLNQTA